jgi:dipeptidase E
MCGFANTYGGVIILGVTKNKEVIGVSGNLDEISQWTFTPTGETFANVSLTPTDAGGGNTFLLVKQLYENDVMQTLKSVINSGTPYLGTSAGSNITGVSMQTTNDMPIVFPESFETLGAINFNLNPHYLDPDKNSNHMGETRETRIKEFHAFNDIPVLGLREGSWLEVKGDTILLKGTLTARLFEKDKLPVEINSGSSLNYLGK